MLIFIALGWSLRARAITGKVLAVIILIPALFAGGEAINKILNPEAPDPLLLAVAVCHSKTMSNDTAPAEHTPEQQAALERLNIAQDNLMKARDAYEKAAEGLQAIAAYNEAMKPLMAYYDNGWLADVNATDAIYERPEAAGEDEIWNMHGGQYELMRELLAISSRFFVHVPGQEEEH